MDKGEAKRRGKLSKESRGGMRQQVSGSPLSSRLVTEKIMSDVHRVMQVQEFQSIEEANTFLARLAGPGLKEALKKAPTLSPQQEAQELAYRAMEAPTRTRALPLAQKALAKDPDCVDALVTLAAASAHSVEDLIAGLEKAVEAGERSLGAQYFEENKGHFWGMLETRPYMRARQQLADLLLDAGRVCEAIGHFEALLDLNPNDNQGVRDILLGCYLAGDDLDGARRLLRVYDEEASAVFAWGRTLERILSGDFKGAEHALKYARSHNRFVELYLTGKKKLPRAMPDSYSFGSEEEALICMETMGDAWAAHPEALIWLLLPIEGVREMDPVLQKKPRGIPDQRLLF
jgi:tetratricopeptide (TPR) repeat protein